MGVYYWNPAANANWNGTAWATTYNGTPATHTFTSSDVAVFTGFNNKQCTINGNYNVGGIDFTGGSSGQGAFTGTFTSAGSTIRTLSMSGDVIFSTGAWTYAYVGTFAFVKVGGTCTLNTNGSTYASTKYTITNTNTLALAGATYALSIVVSNGTLNDGGFTITCPTITISGGSYTLGIAQTTTALTYSSGTLSDGGFALTPTTFTISGGTFTLGHALSATTLEFDSGTLTQGGYAITATNFNIGGGTFTQNGTLTITNSTVSSGSFTLVGGDITFTGTLTVSGGTFTDGGYNITAASVIISSAITLGGGTYTLTGSSGTIWDGGQGLVTASTSTVKILNTGGTFIDRGSNTYGTLYFHTAANSGTVYLTVGNTTFNNIIDDGTVAHTLSFGQGDGGNTISIYGWNVNGSAGKLISIANTDTFSGIFYYGAPNITSNYLSLGNISLSSFAGTWSFVNCIALLTGIGSITGGFNVGQVATVGGLSPSFATATYQWYSGGVLINGATSTIYTIQSSDAGKNLSVVATGSNGNTGTATSANYYIPGTWYWVGGTGTWDGSTATHWSLTSGGAGGAGFPNPANTDNVYFDANSGGGTVTLSGGNLYAQELNFAKNGNFTGILAVGTTILSAYGKITLSSNMSISGAAGQILLMGGGNFTPNGVAIPCSLGFYGISYILGDILYTFAGALLLAQSSSTVYLNNHNVTLTAINSYINIASFSTLNIGSGTITLNGYKNVSSGFIIQMGTSAKITNAANSTIIFTAADATFNPKFVGANQTWGNLYIHRGSATKTLTFTGNNTFTSIKDDGTAAHTIDFTGPTQTVGGFQVSGQPSNLITLTNGTLNFTGTGLVSCDYLTPTSQTVTPSSTWYAGTHSTDGGGNSGWIFTAPPSPEIGSNPSRIKISVSI